MERIIEQNHFRLVRVRDIADMGGKLWELEHTGSGALLVWLDRPEENMTFSIAFTTIPEDSTGVFHILEHSVLCGSDKYPVKEPFVELLKSSLQTFLNAMTFPDKTMYPVSSRNKQDFLNLVSIYMDAVLHPAIHHKQEIFLQEGWRYDTGDEGEPVYQGVVYNEMKGAYASVGNALERQMEQHLFPDTCYRHDSGGDPACIPQLTYEQFLANHKKFYHPSNARIVLDGTIDLDAVLALLHSFLGDYNRRDCDFTIPLQQPVAYHEVTAPYAIGAEEDPAGKTFVSRGDLLCTYADRELQMAADLLGDYLTDGNEAPLKRAILDEGLAADFRVGLHDGIQQAWFGWQAINTDPDKVPRLREVIRQTVEKILHEGLDRDRMESYLSNTAFQLTAREGGGYRGVYECMNVLSAWLYGGDPAHFLCYSKELAGLREKLDTDYYEQLLRRLMLDESGGVLVVLVPSTTLGEENRAAELSRLTAAWGAMEQQAQAHSLALVERLRAWQQTPDSPEALATIPMLKLSDLPEKPTLTFAREDTCQGVTVLRQQLNTPLVYTSLYFNLSGVSLEELPLLSLIRELLGKLPTGNHTAAELKLETLKTLGNLKFSVSPLTHSEDECILQLECQAVFLREKEQAAVALLLEILTDTRFDQPALLRDILRQQRHAYRRALISSGHQFATLRANARLSSLGVVSEHLRGCEYIRWLNEHDDYSDEAMNALLGQMAALAKRLLTRERMLLQASDTLSQAALETLATGFAEGGESADAYLSFPVMELGNEGIEIPSDVAYAAQMGKLRSIRQPGDGSVYAASNILSYAHLWNAIRVQGGAYGAGMTITADGRTGFHTYRDPNAARSLGCFRDSCAFLEEFARTADSLDKFIIGAVGEMDGILSNVQKLNQAASYFLRGIGPDRLCSNYTQLINTTREDLLKIAAALRVALDQKVICVAGSKEQLERCGEQLDSILHLL